MRPSDPAAREVPLSRTALEFGYVRVKRVGLGDPPPDTTGEWI